MASTGSSRTWPSSARSCWSSTTCSGRTRPRLRFLAFLANRSTTCRCCCSRRGGRDRPLRCRRPRRLVELARRCRSRGPARCSPSATARTPAPGRRVPCRHRRQPAARPAARGAGSASAARRPRGARRARRTRRARGCGLRRDRAASARGAAARARGRGAGHGAAPRGRAPRGRGRGGRRRTRRAARPPPASCATPARSSSSTPLVRDAVLAALTAGSARGCTATPRACSGGRRAPTRRSPCTSSARSRAGDRAAAATLAAVGRARPRLGRHARGRRACSSARVAEPPPDDDARGAAARPRAR